jgi:hypothetical protein
MTRRCRYPHRHLLIFRTPASNTHELVPIPYLSANQRNRILVPFDWVEESQEQALADIVVSRPGVAFLGRLIVAIYSRRGLRTSCHTGMKLEQRVGVLILTSLLASITVGSGM